MAATFRLGLTMAGAISAGAYAAGAFDFLMEALDCWEAEKQKRRDTPEEGWDIPRHAVEIPVMSGASAGAIVGALGLVALADCPPDRLPETRQVAGVGGVDVRLQRLYRAWVERPCFVSAAGGQDLLGTLDLDPPAPQDALPASLLDSACLTAIAAEALSGIAAIAAPRPFLAARMQLFLTHTNLRGVPYNLDFASPAGAGTGYGMLLHAERCRFCVTGLGTGDFVSPWASLDELPVSAPGPQPELPIASILGLAALQPPWSDYAQATLGSSAFPVGLAPRAIAGFSAADYANRQWPYREFIDDEQNPRYFRFPPRFTDGTAPADRRRYVTVDGGTIDNEPFELARWSLMKKPGTPNERGVDKACRAVLMIDPFPEPPDYDTAGNLDLGLPGVLARLMPAMINQARFKPDELAAALKEDVYSRYLIAPRRRDAGGVLQPFGIACGLLGGFGGFLAECFRAHDYQLGRRNAYFFLRDSLAMPLDNKVIESGYGPRAQIGAFQSRSASSPAAAGKAEYQLIPLLGSAAIEPPAPTWPRVAAGVVDALIPRAQSRAEALIARVKTAQGFSSLWRAGIGLAWSWYGKSRLGDAIRLRVLRDLVLRDQLEGDTAGAPELDRKVIAALLNPAYDLRTARGIAIECKSTETQVNPILADARYAGLIVTGPPQGKSTTYTHAIRKPGWFASAPLLGGIAAWVKGGPPTID